MQPGPCIVPEPIRGSAGDFQRFRGLFDGKSREKPEFHQPGGSFIFDRKPV
jgi:hypothetical protein